MLVVRNPIIRLLSDIAHEFLVGSLKEEEMPNVDSLILNTGNKNTPKISSKNCRIWLAGKLSTDFLDWVNKHLYPISNYTNVIEKIQSEFPETQLLVLNGDNLIKFVFKYYFNNNWFNISLVQKSIRGSFEAGKISQTSKIFYWSKFFISEETPWIYENVSLLQKCYIRVLHEKW